MRFWIIFDRLCNRIPSPPQEPREPREPDTLMVTIGGKRYRARPTGVQGPLLHVELETEAGQPTRGSAIIRPGQAMNPGEFQRHWLQMGGGNLRIRHGTQEEFEESGGQEI